MLSSRYFVSVLFVLAGILKGSSSQSSMETRVVGGQPAEVNNTRHQVSLRVAARDNLVFGQGFLCGGSLITDKAVLTAAHCMFKNDGTPYLASEFKIVMGNQVLTNSTNTIVRSVSKIIVHANYTNQLANDIAILILSKSVQLINGTSTVGTISLANTTIANGAVCQVTGWGATAYGGYANEILLSADVPVVSLSKCIESYGEYIMDGMFCAGNFTDGGVDACQGDSGGPLICNGTLAGVVSWGNDCALARYPGVYTNVSYFNEWIVKNTSSASGLASVIFVLGLSVLIMLVNLFS